MTMLKQLRTNYQRIVKTKRKNGRWSRYVWNFKKKKFEQNDGTPIMYFCECGCGGCSNQEMYLMDKVPMHKDCAIKYLKRKNKNDKTG